MGDSQHGYSIGTSTAAASLEHVNNIIFGNNTLTLSTSDSIIAPSTLSTLYVYGNIVASGFISAYGESSSGGSSSGDANSIAGKPVIKPQSWSGLDGKALVYDASENSGEGA